EIELERYLRVAQFADEAMLSRYLDARAKKDGKSRAELEGKLLGGGDVSDKDAQAWFDANKAHLPPQLVFEQVKDEIKSHLQEEQTKKKKTELVEKAKKELGATLLLAKPDAPTTDFAAFVKDLPTRGAKNPKVRLVEFADYQCPHCKAAGEVI